MTWARGIIDSISDAEHGVLFPWQIWGLPDRIFAGDRVWRGYAA